MLVCNVSGVPMQDCNYSCPHCRKIYRGVPDLAGIRAACLAIRQTWTEPQLARAEGRYDVMDIPRAHQVTDGMRRNDKMDYG
jgi:hypothetical protein